MAGRNLLAPEQPVTTGRNLLAQPQAGQVVDPVQANAARQSALQAGLIGAGRGMTKVARGLGLMEPESETARLGFEALKEESPVSTFIGEVAGESAPFLVPGLGIGAVASVPARVAASVALGGAEGGILSRGEGRSEAENIISTGIGGAIAGTLELALPRISRLGGALVRRITGKAEKGSLVTPDGQPTPELQDALDKSGLTYDQYVF